MFPLYERFPSLKSVPRVVLCSLPSPVQEIDLPRLGPVWIKRDDLNAPVSGGNKARSLEFLLGGLGEGDRVVTVGGAGSTHVLATAAHAARIGVTVEARRWMHDMNPAAETIARRLTESTSREAGRSAAVTLLAAGLHAARTRTRFIPIGGSTPLGVLGHVNAALELAAQIERGDLPVPDRVVVPLGSGGTTAGLLLGFAIAGLPTTVVGARVGPRIFVNRYAVLRLARATAALIRSLGGDGIPAIDPTRLRIAQHVYGGAYGRPLAASRDAANILQTASGLVLDDTYSAKAWVAALDEVRRGMGPVLFLLTFDARCLTN